MGMEQLLEDTTESYYWIGYLMADGCISYPDLRLSFSQSNRYRTQVIKFVRYVNRGTPHYRKNALAISIRDKDNMPKIVKKFGFTKRKTYNPCNIQWLDSIDESFFLSFLVGYIDGDGCVSRCNINNKNSQDFTISIIGHNSWADNFELINKRLCKIVGLKPNMVHINHQKLAVLNFGKRKIIRFLQGKIKELQLPASYKWDKIGTLKRNRLEIGRHRVREVKRLLDEGWTKVEIAEKLRMSKAGITHIIQRNNIDAYKGRGIRHE